MVGWDGSGLVGTGWDGSARGSMRSEVDRERSEVEVIRKWLTGVLRGAEGREVEVTDFCFYPMEVVGRERKERMVRLAWWAPTPRLC